MNNNNKQYLTLTEALKHTSHLIPKTRTSLTEQETADKIPLTKIDGHWYIAENVLADQIKRRNELCRLEDVISSYIDAHPVDPAVEKKFIRHTSTITSSFILPLENNPLFFKGSFIPSKDLPDLMHAMDNVYYTLTNRNNSIPICQVADELGLSISLIKARIASGHYQAEYLKDTYYMTPKELDRLKAIKDSYIGLYDLVKDHPEICSTEFDIENRSHRSVMNNRFSKSKIRTTALTRKEYGLSDDKKNAYYIPKKSCDEVLKELEPFLSSYGCCEKRIFSLFDDPYWNTHPKTEQVLKQFMKGRYYEKSIRLVKALLYLRPYQDITDCDNNIIEQLFKNIVGDAFMESYFTEFIHFMQKNYECKNDIKFVAGKRKRTDRTINVSPYPFETYLKMGYMIYDEEHINKHDMVKKALQSRKLALMWLSCAWYYIGAWRISDIFNLPVLPLWGSPEEIREKILTGTYREDAKKTAMFLQKVIEDRRCLPRKTSGYQHSHSLVISIPESFMVTIGTIYSICCLHSIGQDTIGSERFILPDFTYFFGKEDYLAVMGNETFQNRRANKSFMDLAVQIAESYPNMTNANAGYVMASFIRSHVHSINELADITSVYLSCKMDGRTSNEIIVRLMEAGTCSFIPYMLLSVVYGDSFRELPFEEQNELIIKSGLDAFAAETSLSRIRDIYTNASAIVNKLLATEATPDQQKNLAIKAIENIVNNMAPAKGPGCDCLLMSVKKPCAFPKQDCLGCPYAIYKESFFFIAIEKIRQTLLNMRNANTEAEMEKYHLLLDKHYFPVMYEILYHLKEYYKTDVSYYIDQILKLKEE